MESIVQNGPNSIGGIVTRCGDGRGRSSFFTKFSYLLLNGTVKQIEIQVETMQSGQEFLAQLHHDAMTQANAECD